MVAQDADQLRAGRDIVRRRFCPVLQLAFFPHVTAVAPLFADVLS
jgi:hypothetical protein